MNHEDEPPKVFPDHPHQCIKCEINFHRKGYRFVINPRHYCWYEKPDHVVEQLSLCPECGAELTQDLDTGDDYCPSCGLITSATIEYCAGEKIKLPYGKK